MLWSAERLEEAQKQSQAIHGNKHVLPVAMAIFESGLTVLKAPEVGVAVDGRIPPNRVLEALTRLCRIGALAEMPHPGPPVPRVFELRRDAYWDLVQARRGSIDRILG
jgi:hypothetical protein